MGPRMSCTQQACGTQQACPACTRLPWHIPSRRSVGAHPKINSALDPGPRTHHRAAPSAVAPSAVARGHVATHVPTGHGARGHAAQEHFTQEHVLHTTGPAHQASAERDKGQRVPQHSRWTCTHGGPAHFVRGTHRRPPHDLCAVGRAQGRVGGDVDVVQAAVVQQRCVAPVRVGLHLIERVGLTWLN